MSGQLTAFLALPGKVPGKGLGVVTDRLDRAAVHGLLAKGQLFRGLRLLEDVGVTSILVAREVCGSRLSAEVAVNALVVTVEDTSHILGIFVGYISHIGDKC